MLYFMKFFCLKSSYSNQTTTLDPIPNTYINDTVKLNHVIYSVHLKFGGFQKWGAWRRNSAFPQIKTTTTLKIRTPVIIYNMAVKYDSLYETKIIEWNEWRNKAGNSTAFTTRNVGKHLDWSRSLTWYRPSIS